MSSKPIVHVVSLLPTILILLVANSNERMGQSGIEPLTAIQIQQLNLMSKSNLKSGSVELNHPEPTTLSTPYQSEGIHPE